jgi:hypothetical protein
MAHENAGLDANAKDVAMGVTDDASLFRTMLRVDPITKRLKVDASISAFTGVADGEAVDPLDTGALLLGTDGSNYQAVSVNSSGRLQVDIISGAGGVQYTEGDTDATITGNVLMFEGAANALLAASGDATNGLDVDVTRLPALVAGSAAIGKLAANSGVDIGDVDVTSAIITGGAVASGATDSGNPLKVGGKYNSTIPTFTDGQRGDLQLTARGHARVSLFSGATELIDTPGGDAYGTGELSIPVLNFNYIYNGSTMDRMRGDTTNGVDVDVTRLSALVAGSAAIGKLAANSGVDIGDVDVTSISAGTNLIGDVGIQPRTTNGLDTFMASGSDGSSILVATAQAVKASAGKVYGYYLYNPEAAVTFVHFYNTASGSVTVGTTNPLFTLQIPPGSAANLIGEIGVTFGTAITIAATTTAGGNTAPATGVSATVFYK